MTEQFDQSSWLSIRAVSLYSVMAIIGNVSATAIASSGRQSRAPAAPSGELAKLKSQLSDWVNCPSGKTSAGKAKIAELSGKIAAITAQAEKAETEKPRSPQNVAPQQSPAKSAQGFRVDGVGNLLNVQA
ncbi:MAG: hypothetical protein ABJB66_20745 [Gemmatimonadaceae bacterium]